LTSDDAGSATESVSSKLARWLAERLGAEDVRITEFRQHTEGWSWQTYTLTAAWTCPSTGARRERGFAVRVQPPDGLLAPYDIEMQYRVHDAVARHSAVPMPELLWLEHDTSVLGQPFYVMARVEGRVPVQWDASIPGMFETTESRARVGRDFVDTLVAIHALDWQAAGLQFLGVPASPRDAALRAIDRWSRMYEVSRLVELPMVREAIGWLRDNVAASERLTLCHGDYRLGNFMIRDDRLVAVFDWELVHIGDPVSDIAYSALPLFRGRSTLVSLLLERAEFFERYEEASGFEIRPDVFRFWTICGLLMAAAAQVRGARAFEDGAAGDLRSALHGHQVQWVVQLIARELEGAS
jgi:aminoglycoside phosphotransferase (APT) family kinase protein